MKFCPLITTVAPMFPEAGLKPEIVGADPTTNVGEVELVPVEAKIVMGPVVAPDGTKACS